MVNLLSFLPVQSFSIDVCLYEFNEHKRESLYLKYNDQKSSTLGLRVLNREDQIKFMHEKKKNHNKKIK